MKFNNFHPKHTTHTLMYQLYTRQHIISLDWRVLCGKHFNTISASLPNVSLDWKQKIRIADPSQRENLGIIVQYKVKVKLCITPLGGWVSLANEEPFFANKSSDFLCAFSFLSSHSTEILLPSYHLSLCIRSPKSARMLSTRLQRPITTT